MKADNITISTIIKAPDRIQRLAGNKGEYCFFAFSVLFIRGIVSGALFIARSGEVLAEYLRVSIKAELYAYATGGFWHVFWLSVMPRLLLIGAIFILSSSALGAPLIFASNMLLGAGFGCVCGAAYQGFGFSGFLFIFTALIIPTIVFALALFSFSFSAVVSSVELFRTAYGGRNAPLTKINEAVQKSLLRAALFTAAASLFESIGFTVFGGIVV
ncbi:MAG: hypothetical protein GX683_06170 [Ruminococcaceae bacterium]|nr:hypothetical protein [Oscillospiraceae bacterium]